MNLKIAPSWNKVLQDEFDKPYFKQLMDFVQAEYEAHSCFPKPEEIFAAFDNCLFDELKVVIIGQDPYHDVGQANGLCFSVHDHIKMPPSLINIFREIENDLHQPFRETGNLERWAQQGVLLLNATLTVRAHQAGSHQGRGWERFTDTVITKISEEKENVVFLLWGGYAKKKGAKVDSHKHLILKSGHPSPLSANRGYWFGNNHFSKANEFLKRHEKKEINW